MARDAVPQAQELPQERFLDRAEQRHVRAILAAGQYGAERDQQQFMQIMAGIILPRVNDLGKAGDEFFHGRASTLNPRLESSHASPSNPRLQPPAPYAIALGATLQSPRQPRLIEIWGPEPSQVRWERCGAEPNRARRRSFAQGGGVWLCYVAD